MKIADIGRKGKSFLDDLRSYSTPSETQYLGENFINNTIIDPYFILFIEENFTGKHYLQIIRREVIPFHSNVFPNANNPNLPEKSIGLQQDVASDDGEFLTNI